VSESKFDWSWDQFELSKDLLQKLISMESLYFHPDNNSATVTALCNEPPLLQTGAVTTVYEGLISEVAADTTIQD
jgi:hypothetical protein